MCENNSCPVHQRVQVRDLRTNIPEGPLMIDYEGRYAVMTSTSMDVLALMALALLGHGLPRFTTCVYEVGEGTLGDLITEDDGEWVEGAAKFSQDHDSWENFEGAHNLVLQGIREGSLF